MIRRNRRPKPTLIVLIAAATRWPFAGVACGDLTGVPASLPTLADSGARVRDQRRAAGRADGAARVQRHAALR